MLEQIPGFVGISSPIATALAMFYVVFTGRLIPRASHDEVVKVLQERNAEVVLDRNQRQSATSLANQTSADQARTTAMTLEAAKFSTYAMSVLQESATGGHVPS